MEQAKKIRQERGRLHLKRFRREIKSRNDGTRRRHGFIYSNFVETLARGERMNDDKNRRIIDFARKAVEEGCTDIDQIAIELLNIALWNMDAGIGKEAVKILERMRERHFLFMIANSANSHEVKKAAVDAGVSLQEQ